MRQLAVPPLNYDPAPIDWSPALLRPWRPRVDTTPTWARCVPHEHELRQPSRVGSSPGSKPRPGPGRTPAPRLRPGIRGNGGGTLGLSGRAYARRLPGWED